MGELTIKEKAERYDIAVEQKEQELNDDEDILQKFSFYTYKDEPNILYLSGLYVNSEYRGEGIGTKILSTADKVAESIGCNSIRLKTEIGSNAERLYRRNGYNTLKKEGKQMWLEKKIEQKSINKVETKFNVGNWYQCIKDFFGKGVTFDKNTAYYCAKEGCLQDEYGCHIAIVKDLYDNFKLWTIQDAKDGDVLYNAEHNYILIYKHQIGTNDFLSYCRLCLNTYTFYSCEEFEWDDLIWIPSTKKQREQLEKAMTEDGYEWDADKKELKKMEQPFAWGEDDDKMLSDIINCIKNLPVFYEYLNINGENKITERFVCDAINWLKLIKERIQQKQGENIVMN